MVAIIYINDRIYINYIIFNSTVKQPSPDPETLANRWASVIKGQTITWCWRYYIYIYIYIYIYFKYIYIYFKYIYIYIYIKAFTSAFRGTLIFLALSALLIGAILIIN